MTTVSVKPLEWRKDGEKVWKAGAITGTYGILLRDDGLYSLRMTWSLMAMDGLFDTLEAAKAAAQADYDARILSAITQCDPEPVDQPQALTERRPNNCRNHLRDSGESYPKSGCAHCKTGGLTGCPYEGKQDGLTVQRYEPYFVDDYDGDNYATMDEANSGDYVKFADYAALEAERDIWKANYDEMASRNEILRECLKLPFEKLLAAQAMLKPTEAIDVRVQAICWCKDISPA